MSGIQYSSEDWNGKASFYASRRYNGSYHVAVRPGSNLILFFQGSSIAYYADKDPKGGPITVTLDGPQGTVANISGKAVDGFEFQQVLWSQSQLAQGDHQIVISGWEGSVGLDYFEITPNNGSTSIAPVEYGPGATNTATNATVIDDRDADVFTYSGNWTEYSSVESESTIYYQGRMHATSTPGDSCTFTFRGTDVWYFTDYNPGNAAVEISVDGESADNVNTASAPGIQRTQRLVWGKTQLTYGDHKVVITHVGSAGSFASVDFFKYAPGVNPTTTSSHGKSTSTNAPGDIRPPPVAAVVLGVVIGGFVIIMIALIVVCTRTCRRGSHGQHSNYSPFPPYVARTPREVSPVVLLGSQPLLGYGREEPSSPEYHQAAEYNPYSPERYSYATNGQRIHTYRMLRQESD